MMDLIPEKDKQEDQRNFIIFVIAALTLYFVFDHFLLAPRVAEIKAAQEAASTLPQNDLPGQDHDAAMMADQILPRPEILSQGERLKFSGPEIMGSIALTGGRLDDLSLRNHYETLDKQDPITLFSPSRTEHPRYVDFGWLGDDSMRIPGPKTRWQVSGGSSVLTQDKPLTLYWENGQGLRFERDYKIDDRFVVTVTQRVMNKSGKEVTLYPYALISQRGLPENMYGRFVVHEGPIGYIGGDLVELNYKKLDDAHEEEFQALRGWIGITEQYWFTGLIPEQGKSEKYRFSHKPPVSKDGKNLYQIDLMGAGQALAPGQFAENTTHVYAGAKKLDYLRDYQESLQAPHFDLVIDFGLYYFLTKPFYIVLEYFTGKTGHFWVAILILTLLVRGALFPLANKSYRSMAKMKVIAPQLTELREKYKDDRVKLQEEMVKLYEKEKVNPMAGCLPILIQIPIFFALFKVLQIIIDMRHAPFFGWIQDMSAPDPTSIFNLFGLLPYDPPSILMIGAWPTFLILVMMIQQHMSPPPQDKMMATMMKFMPLMFASIFSQFAAGLVIYMSCSYSLAVLQQYVLMRSVGAEIHLFKRSKTEQKLEEMVKEGPGVHPLVEMVEEDVEEALFGEDDEISEDGTSQKEISRPKPKKSKKKK